MISKEQQIQFCGFLKAYAEAEKKLEVFRNQLYDQLGSKSEHWIEVFSNLTLIIPESKKAELLTFSLIKTFLAHFRIQYFQPELTSMIIALSKNGDNLMYFTDFLKFVLPKRYVLTEYFVDEIVKNFYEKFYEENINDENKQNSHSAIGEISDLKNNDKVTYKSDTIVVKLGKKKSVKFNTFQRLDELHSTYWYIGRIFEQELYNRKRLTTLINIISAGAKFNIINLFNFIDIEAKGYQIALNFDTFFSKIGKELSKNDLEQIFCRCEKRHKDTFSLSDFKNCFFDKYFTGGVGLCYAHNLCYEDMEGLEAKKDKIFRVTHSKPLANIRSNSTIVSNNNNQRNPGYSLEKSSTFCIPNKTFMTQFSQVEAQDNINIFAYNENISKVRKFNLTTFNQRKSFNYKSPLTFERNKNLLHYDSNSCDKAEILKLVNNKHKEFSRKSLYTERTPEGKYKLGTIMREKRRNNSKNEAQSVLKDLFSIVSDGERHVKKIKEMINITNIDEVQKIMQFIFNDYEKISPIIFQQFCNDKLKLKLGCKATTAIFFRVNPNESTTLEKSMFYKFLCEGYYSNTISLINKNYSNNDPTTNYQTTSQQEAISKQHLNENSINENKIVLNLAALFSTMTTLEMKCAELHEEIEQKLSEDYEFQISKLDYGKKGYFRLEDFYKFIKHPRDKFSGPRSKYIFDRFTRYKGDILNYENFLNEIKPKFEVKSKKDKNEGKNTRII